MPHEAKNTEQSMISDISMRAFMDEGEAVKKLLANAEKIEFPEADIMARAVEWTKLIRQKNKGRGVEELLHTYSLNSSEGVALMCLAEALLRIPDAHTKDALIRDSFEGRDWESYIKNHNSLMMNISSWGIFITGKIIDFGHEPQTGVTGTIKKLVTMAGEPIIREALTKAMEFIGGQFVIGENIEEAIKNSCDYSAKCYRFSYDMLGEGARSNAQAEEYLKSYLKAVDFIGRSIGKNTPLFEAPSISVKLSALHPRYQLVKRKIVMQELLPRLEEIVTHAMQAGISISIDAEESFRLDIEMLLFEKLLENPAFSGWNGIGFVLQAYQKRAFYVIDWLESLARQHKRIIPLRLVKGAYWDSEIKWAQMAGLPSYPVFTRKEHTDLSYIACADKILSRSGIFYPQFATHNAYTISSIIALSKIYGWEKGSFELQRLHGMGEALHDIVVKDFPSRIYAPIGEHKDLLAYLIRRLLENGANSSFVHLLMDSSKTAEEILENPINAIKKNNAFYSEAIKLPEFLYKPHRRNSQGMDFGNEYQLKTLLNGIEKFAGNSVPNIADTKIDLIRESIITAGNSFKKWAEKPVSERAEIIEKCADLLEENKYELIALCVNEAGKTLQDCVSEVREATDFCRYYAAEAKSIMVKNPLTSPTGESNVMSLHPRGVFACISPWNFPLAIFTGQVAAALVTGNCVIAKPAEQTPAIAKKAIEIMYNAGVPKEVLQLIIGTGETAGEKIVTDKNISGVVFTGSLETARKINQSLSARDGAIIPLIAETGGQNCMIVDSSALLEQAADDIILSAFGSAGQRCSALRVLYIQEDIADKLTGLLAGAMQQLKIGTPIEIDTDIGWIIDAEAKNLLLAHIEKMKAGAKFIASSEINSDISGNISGNFIAPHIFEISHINELEREIFGPVLHIIRFKEGGLDKVICEINSSGYGLTFGIHSRIHENIKFVTANIKAGNIYINRSMIGATVGVQPFGGEGLSGTGFKAGGKHYLLRFLNERTTTNNIAAIGGNVALLSDYARQPN